MPRSSHTIKRSSAIPEVNTPSPTVQYSMTIKLIKYSRILLIIIIIIIIIIVSRYVRGVRYKHGDEDENRDNRESESTIGVGMLCGMMDSTYDMTEY